MAAQVAFINDKPEFLNLLNLLKEEKLCCSRIKQRTFTNKNTDLMRWVNPQLQHFCLVPFFFLNHRSVHIDPNQKAVKYTNFFSLHLIHSLLMFIHSCSFCCSSRSKSPSHPIRGIFENEMGLCMCLCFCARQRGAERTDQIRRWQGRWKDVWRS